MAAEVPRGRSSSREQWAVQVAALDGSEAAPRRRDAVSVDRVVTAALELVRSEGYAALTMRRVAAVLDVVPGALYVHVRDRSALDDLMIGRLCAQIRLPAPDGARWREQVLDVCGQLLELYVSHPGLAQAALTAAPRSLDTLRVNEGAIAVLLAGGVPLRAAAWAVDAAFLYVNAYSTVAARRSTERDADGRAVDRDEVLERLRMLPPERFPLSAGHAEELLSGDGRERFDFTLGLIFDGLDADDGRSSAGRHRERG